MPLFGRPSLNWSWNAGVDRGVGTCVLAAAILRNQSEGAPGSIVGLDINPYAGRFVAAPYDAVVRLAIQDCWNYLDSESREIDIFFTTPRR